MSKTVHIKESYREIFPIYINNRREEIEAINELLEQNNYSKIEMIAHKLAGNAGTYGVPDLGRLGKEMESAAKDRKAQQVLSTLRKIEDYITELKVEYVQG